jgi:hypothetical protein
LRPVACSTSAMSSSSITMLVRLVCTRNGTIHIAAADQ